MAREMASGRATGGKNPNITREEERPSEHGPVPGHALEGQDREAGSRRRPRALVETSQRQRRESRGRFPEERCGRTLLSIPESSPLAGGRRESGGGGPRVQGGVEGQVAFHRNGLAVGKRAERRRWTRRMVASQQGCAECQTTAHASGLP